MPERSRRPAVHFDAGVPHRLARRHQRKLREAVQEVQFLLLEVLGGVETPGFRAVVKAQSAPVDERDGTDPRPPLDQSLPELPRVPAQRRYDPDPRNDDAPAPHDSGLRRRARIRPAG